MRKWPNRLGKLASATLLSMGSEIEGSTVFIIMIGRRPHGIPTTVDPVAAGSGGGLSGQYPFALQRVPNDVDARGSHFGAARQVGPDVLGCLRRQRSLPGAESRKVRR